MEGKKEEKKVQKSVFGFKIKKNETIQKEKKIECEPDLEKGKNKDKIVFELNVAKFFEKHLNKNKEKNIIGIEEEKMEVKKNIRNKKNNEMNLKKPRQSELKLENDNDNEQEKDSDSEKDGYFDKKKKLDQLEDLINKVRGELLNLFKNDKRLEEESLRMDCKESSICIYKFTNIKAKKIDKLFSKNWEGQNFEKFRELTKSMIEEEEQNIKTTDLLKSNAFAAQFEYLQKYFNVLVENEIEIYKIKEKVYVRKINEQNLFNREIKKSIKELIDIFSSVLNHIEKIDTNQSINPKRIAAELKEEIMTMNKNRKIINLENSDIPSDLKRKNENYTKNVLSSFYTFYDVLENNIRELHDISNEIDKYEKVVENKEKKIYDEFLGNLPIFDENPVDIMKDLLSVL